MKEIVLIKLGEMVLKGLNRRTFEDVLIKNIKYRLRGLGKFEIKIAQSTIYVTPLSEDTDLDDVCERISEVFGIVTFSRACVCDKTLEDILAKAPDYCKGYLEDAKTFKVESKRSDKRFPYKSPEISAQVGGKLLETCPHLKVDVKNPEVTVTVEVRDFGAYIHADPIRGAGGIPVARLRRLYPLRDHSRSRRYARRHIGACDCADQRRYRLSCRRLYDGKARTKAQRRAL